MRSVLMMIVLSVTLLAGCSSMTSDDVASYELQSSGIRKVAIVDVQGAINGESAQESIFSCFQKEFMKRGYQVIERKQIQQIIKEQDFQQSGITNDYGATEFGKICNAQAILLVNIPEYGKEIHMTAKLLNTETASILWTSEGSASTGATKASITASSLAFVTSFLIPCDNTSERILTSAASAMLGGAAGKALSPSEEKMLKKLIKKKMCRNLPRCM